MKEIPILFNGAMVRAILAGQKTQTRRLVKPMKSQQWLSEQTLLKSPRAKPVMIKGAQWAQFAHPLAGQTINGLKHDDWSPLTCIRSPYGKPGDRLWVQECLRPGKAHPELMAYKADDALVDLETMHWPASTEDHKAIPAKRMPRWACRLELEVVSVRVERLQNISEADAQAEGVKHCEHELDGHGCCYANSELFSILWSSIYGTDSYLANPWVWVVEFKVVMP